MNAEQMFEREGYTKCSVSPNEEPPTYSMSKDGTDSFISFDEKDKTYYSFAVTETGDTRPVKINYQLMFAIFQQFEELKWL